MSDDRKRAWLGQPHLRVNLEKKFGEEVADTYRYITPGTAGIHQVRGENPENSIVHLLMACMYLPTYIMVS